MEELIAMLFEFGAELVFQFVMELLIESGFQLGRAAIGPRPRRKPSFVLATAGQLLLGSVAGLVTFWLLPDRILPPVALPGISLILSPLATGVLMRGVGNWRRKRGLPVSALATFTGGAAFAFASAAVRYLLVTGRVH